MSASKILFNWLLTIIIGSISSFLLIFLHIVIFEGSMPGSDAFIFIFYFMLLSALFSIPAILILKGTSNIILNKEIPKRNKIRLIHTAHIMYSLITFLIIIVAFEVNELFIFIFFIYMFITYTSIGVYLWNKFLLKEINS